MGFTSFSNIAVRSEDLLSDKLGGKVILAEIYLSCNF